MAPRCLLQHTRIRLPLVLPTTAPSHHTILWQTTVLRPLSTVGNVPCLPHGSTRGTVAHPCTARPWSTMTRQPQPTTMGNPSTVLLRGTLVLRCPHNRLFTNLMRISTACPRPRSRRPPHRLSRNAPIRHGNPSLPPPSHMAVGDRLST